MIEFLKKKIILNKKNIFYRKKSFLEKNIVLPDKASKFKVDVSLKSPNSAARSSCKYNIHLSIHTASDL